MKRAARAIVKLLGALSGVVVTSLAITSGLLSLASCGKGLITSKQALGCASGACGFLPYSEMIRREPGLIGYYRMAMSGPSQLLNSAPAQSLGAASITGSNFLQSPPAIRNEGDPSARFAGATYATIGAGPDFGGSNASFSVEAWVLNSGTCAAADDFVSLGSSVGGSPKVSLGCEPGGPGPFVPRMTAVDTSAVNGQSVGPVQPSGAWVHLVGVNRGGTIELYVNGTLYAPATPNFLGNFNISGFQARFAANPAGAAVVDASIDEIAIYSSALSPDQVRLHYFVGAGGGP